MSPDSALDDALGRRMLRALDNRQLKLTLMPTEQCNFRCTYCYEDFALGTMPRWAVDALKRLMDARAPQLQLLDLRWFGGEPLMAFPIVVELSQHAQRLAARYRRLTYVSSVTTNAYLLDRARFQELLRLGVRQYQISLDGFGEHHDRTRRRSDGAGTFDRIWSNLLATRAVAGEFSIMLRVHFTPSTLDHVRTLVVALNRELGDDPRFRIFFKAICRLGGPNDENIERSPEAWQRRAKAELTALVKRQEAGTVDPAAAAYICYAAEPNSLIVRSDGHLARCTVAFNDPRNRVGCLRPDGTLAIDDERSRLWFEGLESGDPETLHCPLSKMGPPPPQLIAIDRLRAASVHPRRGTGAAAAPMPAVTASGTRG